MKRGRLVVMMIAAAGSTNVAATRHAQGSSSYETRSLSERARPSDEPSLDELLGLDEEDDAGTADDATATDLDRKLSGEEIGEAFDQAVRLMGDAAQRVGAKNDVSIGTQRVQEDALRRLDQLIASIESQQQQQQQQQQSSSQRQQQQQQQPGQQQAKNQQESAKTSDPQSANAPGLREGALGEGVGESARAAWGALPARVRDMLVQGVSDQFSATYRRMTEEYYKRLAEESGKE